MFGRQGPRIIRFPVSPARRAVTGAAPTGMDRVTPIARRGIGSDAFRAGRQDARNDHVGGSGADEAGDDDL